jgi:hypothetical protein
MTVQRAFFAVLVGGLALMFVTAARAQVDARRIEEVFKKEVLTPEDLAVIDAFMSENVGRLVRTIDFTEVAKTRAVILSHQRTHPQYGQRFSEAALKEIGAGLEYAAGIGDANRRFKVFTNLLILTSELNDPRLIDLAIRMIAQENNTVRYWAVRAATNPGVWDKLGQDAAAGALAGRIIGACGPVVQSSSPEVLHLMAQFAGRYNTAAADELLGRVAEARIQDYANRTVGYELADAAILKVLAGRITAGGTAGSQLAREFAQLYSFALQRFLRGVRADTLAESSRNHLASVLVETEEQCLSKLLGAPQSQIRRAIETGDWNALQAEHDRLLGSANQAGVLPAKFSFGYGPAGKSRAPLVLPEPAPPKAAPGAPAPPAPTPAAEPPAAEPPATQPPAPPPPAPQPK